LSAEATDVIVAILWPEQPLILVIAHNFSRNEFASSCAAPLGTTTMRSAIVSSALTPDTGNRLAFARRGLVQPKLPLRSNALQ